MGEAAVDMLDYLGSPASLKANKLHDAVLAGLPYSSFEHIKDRLGLTNDQLSEFLGVAKRTLLQRKKDQRLKMGESDRLMRLVRALAETTTTLTDEQRAVTWLKQPNRALGGATPLAMLHTEIGEQEVYDVLGRIRYGVYS